MLILLYSQCRNDAQAARQSDALKAALAGLLPHCHVRLSQPPERYWKIREYFGFHLELRGAGLEDYRLLIASHPGNWWLCEDDYTPEAVWNAGEGPPLLIPEARWAQLIPQL